MKIKTLALISIFAGQGLAVGWAQSPGGDQMDAGASSSPGNPTARTDRKDTDRGMKKKFLENLTPEMKQRFFEARNKAMQDPKIQELQKNLESSERALREAMRAKMQEIDPSLAEFVKKEFMRHGGGEMAAKNPEANKDGGKARKGAAAEGDGVAKLTDQEREKLMTARSKAKADPSVETAKARLDAAVSPEERRSAGEVYRKAIAAAILKNDPSMASILDKMTPPPQPAALAAPAPDKMEMN